MLTHWIIDPTHSELIFKIKHLMISHVAGEFRNFTASIDCQNGAFNQAGVKVVIDAASVFTNNTERDEHLRSADFFDVAQFPTITFEGNEFSELDEHHYRLLGNLTMKGITKPVRLEIEYGGKVADPWGGYRAGFTLHGSLNRKDWGITWNSALDAVSFVLGEEINFTAELQFIKQTEAVVAE
jgi:polyisoprenoid-binding protein YceI